MSVNGAPSSRSRPMVTGTHFVVRRRGAGVAHRVGAAVDVELRRLVHGAVEREPGLVVRADLWSDVLASSLKSKTVCAVPPRTTVLGGRGRGCLAPAGRQDLGDVYVPGASPVKRTTRRPPWSSTPRPGRAGCSGSGRGRPSARPGPFAGSPLAVAIEVVPERPADRAGRRRDGDLDRGDVRVELAVVRLVGEAVGAEEAGAGV